jgi:predicted Rossmann fold flavoprotein
MSSRRVIVVGGGAAGFFAAITCAEASPDSQVELLERGPQFLAKVRISGGGRCNVTHACFDPRELARHFPRGGQALIAAFGRFQPRDTLAWFARRGVTLKTEADGRMFPVTDSSQTVIDCLLAAARAAGVRLRLNCGVERVAPRPGGGFVVTLADGEQAACERLLLATGGCRGLAAGQLPASLGHSLEPPVPSLFTFQIETDWVRSLAGVAVPGAECLVPGTGLRERGPVLFTHWGLSGPAILRLSARGARALHACAYRFALHVNWLPDRPAEALSAELESRRAGQPGRRVVSSPLALPARLWEQLALAAGIGRDNRWAGLTRAARHRLVQQLVRTELLVTGKSLNKEEFVTCGGVRLREVDFRTMDSRLCPGLHLAGELLDIDGLTGGFNFQAAWTTGWIAGRSMAEAPARPTPGA